MILKGQATTTKMLRAGPRTLECGGASGPDPEQLNMGYDVSGVSRKGGEYERGSPLSYRGPGEDPPGNIWEIVVPEKRFLSLF